MSGKLERRGAARVDERTSSAREGPFGRVGMATAAAPDLRASCGARTAARPATALLVEQAEIEAPVAAGLEAAAAARGIPVPRLLRGAWDLVLARYAGEGEAAEDLPVGEWIGALRGQDPAPTGAAPESPLIELESGEGGGAGPRSLLLHYDPLRLDRGAAPRMLAHCRNLLRELATRPEARVAELEMLGAAERRQLLFEWNATARPYPETTLSALCRARAAEHPERTALAFGGDSLAYGELDRRANRLAHRLQRLGVGPGRVVGVFLERSFEMVIGLLGILRAGGAYLPLDPEYPAERLEFMISDAEVSALVTSRALCERLPRSAAPRLCLDALCLDAGRPEIAREPDRAPAREAGPDDLAYLIYTSGSTGRPKGAPITHRAICNRLLWMQDEYRLGPGDSVLQKTPFGFDVSVWEFFWPLLAGARLVLARPGGHRDAAYLQDLIRAESVTVLHFVPSMLHRFLEQLEAGSCGSLRHVFCSGEALSFELKERFFARLGASLHNLYGPTEAAVDVSYFACRPGGEPSVPIGRPVANTGLYVLDSRGRPQPVGAAGELHIGGVQLARGYHRRPELSAERFVPDPFGGDPGARLYRTGDRARYRSDGNIEYLGRLDFQTKIRGFRVEPGEIEAALREHPEVREAAVVARGEEPESRRLVAYVVAKPGAGRLPGRLRAFLAGKLPEHMVPSAFAVLEAMPLTPSGKLDRRALPAPTRERPALERAYVAPEGPLERHLAGLWGELLGLDRVGARDPFFELGGDSLLAAAFINDLRRELDASIYIVSLFEAPTVADYAAFLRRDYAPALARRFPGEILPAAAPGRGEARIDAAAVARMRRLVPRHLEGPDPAAGEPRNPPALFILAPPRSGTTLVRVMLAGHPGLFSCSELQLLGFRDLAQRRRAFQGRLSLWLDGTVRALMQIRGCDADSAWRLMEDYERRGLSTRAFYRELQQGIGGRTLVDKSPFYALDREVLEKAERDFRDPLYLHLVRHPYAAVRSFEDYHMDQVLPLGPHGFSRRQVAELVWTLSHQNILAFLEGVPPSRFAHVRFEDLVARPGEELGRACEALGVGFHPGLLEPYAAPEAKMLDGVHGVSTPMGDRKFLEHGRIEPAVGEAWRGVEEDDFLGEPTWELAAALGYERPAGRAGSRRDRRRRRLAHREGSRQA